MAKTIFGVLKEEYESQIRARETAMGNGSPKNYEEYMRMVGTVQGLHIAISYIADLEKNYLEDDDD